jgi:hypothetical protein
VHHLVAEHPDLLHLAFDDVVRQTVAACTPEAWLRLPFAAELGIGFDDAVPAGVPVLATLGV